MRGFPLMGTLATFALATLLASSASAVSVSSNFDSDADGVDGWHRVVTDVALYGADYGQGYDPVTREATGGNPGGYLRIVAGSGAASTELSPPARFSGDLSTFEGGILSFDMRLLDPATGSGIPAPSFGRVIIYRGQDAQAQNFLPAVADVVASGPVVSGWTRYVVALTADAFRDLNGQPISADYWHQVLTGPARVRMDIDFHNPEYGIYFDQRPEPVIAFDNFVLTEAVSASSGFDNEADGVDGWHRVVTDVALVGADYGQGYDPVTRETSGGNPGGYLRIVAGSGAANTELSPPARFSGDLSSFEGGFLSFDMRLLDPATGNGVPAPSFGRVIIYRGQDAQAQNFLPAVADAVTSGPDASGWTRYTVPLTADAFRDLGDQPISTDYWHQVLTGPSRIRFDIDFHNPEYGIYFDQRPEPVIGFDNFRLIAPVNVPLDTDRDGIPDATDNCVVDPNPTQADGDGDGAGDACDPCPADPLNDQDGDGLCGNVDNCPTAFNPNQEDVDHDGIGDACNDANDSDGDEWSDALDNCPAVSNRGQSDRDGDGSGDACDVCPDDPTNDLDGDGVCGNHDNCPTVRNSDQTDTDGDGLGDACDADDDNDGIPDSSDVCPLNADPNQIDSDGDGMGNACDTDDDNDGIPDANDRCQFTPAGAVVASDGCSIAELCPCQNSWKNHGGYVSCVAKSAESFVRQGLMTPAQKDTAVSAAANSTCGK